MEQSRDAVASAVRTLARRDHSENELRRKLQDRGFSSGEIETAVAKMQDYGYLDDNRFARLWAESAIRGGRGFGPRLRLELLRRGVADTIISEVLGALAEDFGEREVLTGVLERKFSGFNFGEAGEREKRRVISYLQRRGFSLSMILDVLNEQQGCRGNLF